MSSTVSTSTRKLSSLCGGEFAKRDIDVSDSRIQSAPEGSSHRQVYTPQRYADQRMASSTGPTMSRVCQLAISASECNCPRLEFRFLGCRVFELYLQRLLTGLYHEHTEFTTYPTRFNSHNPEPQPDENNDTMVWCVKAAVLAWKLGYHLGVPKFQNYGMGRLSTAYMRPVPKSQTTGDILQWTRFSRRSTSSLKISSFATRKTTCLSIRSTQADQAD
jgi:hypothetical protein